MAAQKDVLDVVFQKVANIFKVNHLRDYQERFEIFMGRQ